MNPPKNAKFQLIYPIFRPNLMKMQTLPRFLVYFLLKQQPPPKIRLKFQETPIKISIEFHLHSPKICENGLHSPKVYTLPRLSDDFDICPNRCLFSCLILPQISLEDSSLLLFNQLSRQPSAGLKACMYFIIFVNSNLR